MTTEAAEPLAAPTPDEREAHVAELLLAAGRCPFGPTFFLQQLGAFIRDRCPDSTERLPQLQLTLASDEPITVCHVIALSPRWVAVAARNSHDSSMRTEILPYETIQRVTVGSIAASGHGIGFDHSHKPLVLGQSPMTPEEALALAAGADH